MNAKYFLVIRNNIPVNDYDFAFTYAMNHEKNGWNADYAKNEKGEFRDFENGYLLIDYTDFCNSDIVNTNNFSVLQKTYEKLPFFISAFLYHLWEKKDIDKALEPLVEKIKEKVAEFNGFTFKKIEWQEIRRSGYQIQVDSENEYECLLETGDHFIPNKFYDILEEKNIDWFDVIFSNRYYLIIDTEENRDYLRKMVEDGFIDLDNNTIIALYGYNKYEVW